MNETVRISVKTKGGVSPEAADRLKATLRRLSDHLEIPILSASGSVVRHQDPARSRSVQASATVDLNGHWERASVEADEELEAIDLLDAKLRRIVRRYNERRQHKGRLHDPIEGGEGHWRHGDLPTRRAPWPELGDDERTIVERALHGPASRTMAEAAFDLDALGQDFTLFVDEVTGHDSILCRSEEGDLELVQLDHAGPNADGTGVGLEVAEAIEQLIMTGNRLVFFRDRATERGAVVYHRNDGHHGLIRLA